MNFLRKIYWYYPAIILPMVLMIVLVKYKFIGNVWFCISLLFYALIYRSLTDYWRLRSKNVIEKRNLLKIMSSGVRFKYFKELYLP